MQTWVVKLSKLCNMRCSYCYEWNELGNPARMSPELWRRTVRAAVEYNRRRIATMRGLEKTPVLIVLHGGEPLALPVVYLRQILADFRQLTRDAPGRYQIEAAIQSAHAIRRITGSADWTAILTLYDALIALTGSNVAAVNRAVALGEVEGPEAGLAALDALAGDAQLADFQPYLAARAELLSRIGDVPMSLD